MGLLSFAKSVAAFGLKKFQGRRIRLWAEARGAVLVDADGCLGSGVFVALHDGTEAIFTAKHVISESLETGELTVMRFGAPSKSLLPDELFVDADHDAGVVICSQLKTTGKVVHRDDWRHPPRTPSAGQGVQCSGAPGEWKSVPDAVSRTIGTIKWLGLMTAVTRSTADLVTCDVDEGGNVPSSFGGMSGGPAITLDCRLFGINVTERRRLTTTDGELRVLPLALCLGFLDDIHRDAGRFASGGGTGCLTGYVIEATAGRRKGNKLALEVGYRRYIRTSTTGQPEVAVRLVRVTVAPISAQHGTAVRLSKTVAINADSEWFDVGNAAISAVGLSNYRVITQEPA